MKTPAFTMSSPLATVWKARCQVFHVGDGGSVMRVLEKLAGLDLRRGSQPMDHLNISKLAIAFLVLLTLTLLALPTRPPYGGGRGSPEDPYLIYSAEQMQAIGANLNDWDKHFKLMGDINLMAYDGLDGRPPFNLIGNSWLYFTGSFDGNGKTISNFRYQIRANFIGLFRHVYGPEAEIKHLILKDSVVEAQEGYYVGSLVGLLLEGATLIGCHVENGEVRGQGCLGGLVGCNSHGIVTNCHCHVTVTGYSRLGGLAGRNVYGMISNCTGSGQVTASGVVGGLVGINGHRTASDSGSSGLVPGQPGVGSLVGSNFKGTVTQCHWTPSVSESSPEEPITLQ